MKTEKVKLDDISQDPANLRKHGLRNLESIKASLRKFGQRKPIVVDKRGIILAGNGTYEAAKLLGWDSIYIVRTDLTGSDATAYAIADNRTAELAEWDDTALAEQLRSLQSQEFDLTDVGYTDDEVQQLIDKIGNEILGASQVIEDEAPELPADPITKPGDLWILGDHRLLCGDSTKAEDVGRLMAGAKADLCFTSPPYGQQRDYTEEGKAKIADWDGLMRGVFGNLPMTDEGQVLVNLGLIHRDGEWIPYWDAWIEWMREQGWRRFGWYVWDQMHGLRGDWSGRFAPSHEFIFHFNKQAKKPIKWVESLHAGEKGGALRGKSGTIGDVSSEEIQTHKLPDSVWRIQRQKGGIDGHPAPFSVPLVVHALKSWDGIVYEPFSGSGTTIIACEQLGRKCYGMEISPAYCDVIVKRWENLTGHVAIRE